jgi:MFS family permease
LALIVTAQFMVILDVAIVNVALPSIQSDLGFSDATIQWVVSAYAIFFGGVLLLGGRLADLFGRRRLFMGGLALFGATSLLCGLAWSEGSLITFRALQGLGGALMAPIALTPVLLRESRANLPHRHFDLAGAGSITAGLMLLVYALTRATTDGWGTPLTIGLLVASATLIVGFIGIEHRSPQPLLPLRIFRLPTLAASNAIMLLVGAVTFSEFFVLSLYVQDVLHYTAVQTGLAFAAFALTVVVVSNLAQLTVARFGVRATLTAGLVA